MQKLKSWWLDLWYGKEISQTIVLEKKKIECEDINGNVFYESYFKTKWAVRDFFDHSTVWIISANEMIDNHLQAIFKEGFLCESKDVIVPASKIHKISIIDCCSREKTITYRPHKNYDEPYSTE